MPIIVIAHTFCASRDTRISYRRCLFIQGYFCAVQNYAEEAELNKCSWYPKENWGDPRSFQMKLQFGKERHTSLCILELFTNIVDELSSKNARLPPISFWISIILVKICFSRIFTKPRKNTFTPGRKTRKKPDMHVAVRIVAVLASSRPLCDLPPFSVLTFPYHFH